MSVLRQQIRCVLKEQGRFGGDPGEIEDDTNLYQLGMTSHASVGVMLSLEAAFDVEFPDRMLTRGVFESVATIGTAIEELLLGK